MNRYLNVPKTIGGKPICKASADETVAAFMHSDGEHYGYLTEREKKELRALSRSHTNVWYATVKVASRIRHLLVIDALWREEYRAAEAFEDAKARMKSARETRLEIERNPEENFGAIHHHLVNTV